MFGNFVELLGNGAFLQNFHTRKLGEITVFCAVIIIFLILFSSKTKNKSETSSAEPDPSNYVLIFAKYLSLGISTRKKMTSAILWETDIY